ncbi:hypothetical protein ACFQVA_19970 [Actinomadura keratinilytica]
MARLYERASDATQRYEAGLRASRAQRREAERLERRLAEERRVLATYRADLGRIASAQYRAGAGLPYTARLLLADDPEGLLRSQHAANQADLAVTNALGRAQRAERRLAEGSGPPPRSPGRWPAAPTNWASSRRGSRTSCATPSSGWSGRPRPR